MRLETNERGQRGSTGLERGQRVGILEVGSCAGYTKARSDTVCFTLSEQVCNSKNCGGQERRWVNTKDTIPVIFVSQRGEGEKRVALNW